MLFSNKDVYKIIAPIMIEMLLSIAIGMVDSVMVASAGEAAVSGVSLVNTVNVLLINFFASMAGGGTVVIAQLLGAKDKDNAKETGKQTFYLTLFISIAISVICLIFRNGLLNLIYGNVAEDVMKSSQDYFFFTIISTPFLAVSSASAAICRAQGETKRPMYFTIITNLVNVAGNATLIYGFNMGAAGAAIATSFARIVQAALTFTFVTRSKTLEVGLEKVLRYKPSAFLIKRICMIGIPNGLENSMFQIGKVLLSSLVSTFGTASIAANAVANTLTSFQYAQGNAMGSGLISIVGKCIGAGEKQQAKRYAKKIVWYAYVGMFIVSAVLCLLAPFIIDVYNLSPQSAEICTNLIYAHSIAVCLVWPLAFVSPNAFRAANDVKFTTLISTLSMWVFRIGLSYVFAYALNLGVYSVWLAMFCDWIFRILFFAPRLFGDRWLNKHRAFSQD